MPRTPGPWRVMRDPRWGMGVMGTRGTQGEPVAQVFSFFKELELGNATLIAAAPDLLAACEEAEQYILSSNARDDRTLEVIDMLFTVIRKAQGIT